MSHALVRQSLAVLGTAAVLAAALLPALPMSAAGATPACQFAPQGTFTIVTFGSRLFADREAEEAAGPARPVNLAPGTYRVTLVSYDNHFEKILAQRHEQWFAELQDSSGQKVAATHPISDLPEDSETLTEIVDHQLSITRPVASVTPRHAFFPSSGAESITAVCAAFERLAEPLTSPSPSPSPSPTSSPTPARTLTPATPATLTPEPAPAADNDDNRDFSLAIKKTDHRNTTRPGHSLTYEIKVRNSGSGHIDDIVVTDVLPSATTITQISNSGTLQGHTVTWPKFALSPDEEQFFYATVSVKADTSSGHTLTNNAKAHSRDKGISANDIDTTVVEAQRTPRIKAAATAAPTPSSVAVPVTAKTGPGAPPFAILATLLGSASLFYTLRRK